MEITHDVHNLIQLNYEPLISKIKSALAPWYLRGLNLLGKIEVINTLAASLLWYRMAVLPKLPALMIDRIHKIFLHFIWGGGKKAKIPLKFLQGNKLDGGLGLANLAIRDQAFKALWPIKLCRDPLLAKLAYNTLRVDEVFWNASITQRDLQSLLKREKISPFWYAVALDWGSVPRITILRVSYKFRTR